MPSTRVTVEWYDGCEEVYFATETNLTETVLRLDTEGGSHVAIPLYNVRRITT